MMFNEVKTASDLKEITHGCPTITVVRLSEYLVEYMNKTLSELKNGAWKLHNYAKVAFLVNVKENCESGHYQLKEQITQKTIEITKVLNITAHCPRYKKEEPAKVSPPTQATNTSTATRVYTYGVEIV